jgi:hypothetical protein
MSKRGRKSLAALEVVYAKPVEAVERLKAPDDLVDEEVEVWAAVVDTMPADWFTPATVPLLKQYCRHSVQAKRIAEMIERATSDPELNIKDWDRLLKMQERESRMLSSLAVKMRISQSATRNDRGNRNTRPTRKPWEG